MADCEQFLYKGVDWQAFILYIIGWVLQIFITFFALFHTHEFVSLTAQATK